MTIIKNKKELYKQKELNINRLLRLADVEIREWKEFREHLLLNRKKNKAKL